MTKWQNIICTSIALCFFNSVHSMDDWRYAVVKSVMPVYETHDVPSTNCWTETVEKDKSRFTSNGLLGALGGGVIGSRFGGGDGVPWMTFLGAVIGNEIGISHDEPEYKDKQRCHTAYKSVTEITKYAITVMWDNRLKTIYTDKKYNVGDRLSIKDFEVDLS